MIKKLIFKANKILAERKFLHNYMKHSFNLSAYSPTGKNYLLANNSIKAKMTNPPQLCDLVANIWWQDSWEMCWQVSE